MALRKPATRRDRPDRRHRGARLQTLRDSPRPAAGKERRIASYDLRDKAPGGALITRAFETEVDMERGTIAGYANKFDIWDSYNTRFLKGCFEGTIKDRHDAFVAAGKPTRVKFLWQHRRAEPLGLPIELREDSEGLVWVARVADPDHGLGRRALTLAAEGVVDGLSIGFDYNWDSDDVRFLELDEFEEHGFDPDDWLTWWYWPAEFTRVDLFESSLVTFPGNDESRVEIVRCLERTLVQGWSPSQALDLRGIGQDDDEGAVADDDPDSPACPGCQERAAGHTFNINIRTVDHAGLGDTIREAIAAALTSAAPVPTRNDDDVASTSDDVPADDQEPAAGDDAVAAELQAILDTM